MSEITKPDYTYLWSSGGAVVSPSNVKIQTGWTAEVPPFQWENWSQNRQDQAIAHVLQHGISVWDAVTEYQAGKSYVTGSNGKVYVAITTNINQNPTSDTLEVNWADAFKCGFAVITTSATWTVPAILKLGLKKAKVTVIGAGGGGGKGSGTTLRGGGGGAGGRSIRLVDLTGVSSVVVSVGGFGTGTVTAGGAGNPGVASSFGAFCSATGGGGGSGSAGSEAGGFSGVGAGGDINEGLGDGEDGEGNSGGGGGGAGGRGSDSTTVSAKGYGGGGGGSSSLVSMSGNGFQGLVTVEW